MDAKPLPALYCCYLLRSTVRHASLYVGSTPDPARRLRQHNGTTTGGANRTARNSLRPWEMACIVTGFPSNIAALQFEWAWQNAHLTRRIADHERISVATVRTKVSRATGQPRRRPGRPGMSLADRLANLHLLLRAPSFERWPLELRFFAEDVYRAWKKRCIDLGDDLAGSVRTLLDVAAPTADAAPESGEEPTVGASGLEGIDATYAPLREHVDKSCFLLAEGEIVKCSVCRAGVEREQTVLVCSHAECRMASHMSCLATHFLTCEQAEGKADTEIMVPKFGTCPDCSSDLKWVDLVQEMSLRLRAGKNLDKLLKKKRTRKKATSTAAATTTAATTAVASTSAEIDVDDSEDNFIQDFGDEDDLPDDLLLEDIIDEPLRDHVDDSDAQSVISEPGILSQRSARIHGGLDDVVEDSEPDEIIILD